LLVLGLQENSSDLAADRRLVVPPTPMHRQSGCQSWRSTFWLLVLVYCHHHRHVHT